MGHDGEDEERWRAAEAVLAGADSPELRRQQRPMWIGVVALLSVVIAAGVLLSLWLAPRIQWPNLTTVAPWRQVLALVLMAGGVVTTGVALVQLSRTLKDTSRPVPQALLSRSQRRTLLRQVRGRIPAQPEHLPLVRDSARRVAQQQALLTLGSLGTALINVGLAAFFPLSWLMGLHITAAVVLVVVALLSRRFVNQARQFLAEH